MNIPKLKLDQVESGGGWGVGDFYSRLPPAAVQEKEVSKDEIFTVAPAPLHHDARSKSSSYNNDSICAQDSEPNTSYMSIEGEKTSKRPSTLVHRNSSESKGSNPRSTLLCSAAARKRSQSKDSDQPASRKLARTQSNSSLQPTAHSPNVIARVNAHRKPAAEVRGQPLRKARPIVSAGAVNAQKGKQTTTASANTPAVEKEPQVSAAPASVAQAGKVTPAIRTQRSPDRVAVSPSPTPAVVAAPMVHKRPTNLVGSHTRSEDRIAERESGKMKETPAPVSSTLATREVSSAPSSQQQSENHEVARDATKTDEQIPTQEYHATVEDDDDTFVDHGSAFDGPSRPVQPISRPAGGPAAFPGVAPASVAPQSPDPPRRQSSSKTDGGQEKASNAKPAMQDNAVRSRSTGVEASGMTAGAPSSQEVHMDLRGTSFERHQSATNSPTNAVAATKQAVSRQSPDAVESVPKNASGVAHPHSDNARKPSESFVEPHVVSRLSVSHSVRDMTIVNGKHLWAAIGDDPVSMFSVNGTEVVPQRSVDGITQVYSLAVVRVPTAVNAVSFTSMQEGSALLGHGGMNGQRKQQKSQSSAAAQGKVALWCGLAKGLIAIIDLSLGVEDGVIRQAHGDTVDGLWYMETGKRVWSAGREKAVKVWDPQTRRAITKRSFTVVMTLFVDVPITGQVWGLSSDALIRVFEPDGRDAKLIKQPNAANTVKMKADIRTAAYHAASNTVWVCLVRGGTAVVNPSTFETVSTISSTISSLQFKGNTAIVIGSGGLLSSSSDCLALIDVTNPHEPSVIFTGSSIEGVTSVGLHCFADFPLGVVANEIGKTKKYISVFEFEESKASRQPQQDAKAKTRKDVSPQRKINVMVQQGEMPNSSPAATGSSLGENTGNGAAYGGEYAQRDGPNQSSPGRSRTRNRMGNKSRAVSAGNDLDGVSGPSGGALHDLSQPRRVTPLAGRRGASAQHASSGGGGMMQNGRNHGGGDVRGDDHYMGGGPGSPSSAAAANAGFAAGSHHAAGGKAAPDTPEVMAELTTLGKIMEDTKSMMVRMHNNQRLVDDLVQLHSTLSQMSMSQQLGPLLEQSEMDAIDEQYNSVEGRVIAYAIARLRKNTLAPDRYTSTANLSSIAPNSEGIHTRTVSQQADHLSPHFSPNPMNFPSTSNDGPRSVSSSAVGSATDGQYGNLGDTSVMRSDPSHPLSSSSHSRKDGRGELRTSAEKSCGDAGTFTGAGSVLSDGMSTLPTRAASDDKHMDGDDPMSNEGAHLHTGGEGDTSNSQVSNDAMLKFVAHISSTGQQERLAHIQQLESLRKHNKRIMGRVEAAVGGLVKLDQNYRTRAQHILSEADAAVAYLEEHGIKGEAAKAAHENQQKCEPLRALLRHHLNITSSSTPKDINAAVHSLVKLGHAIVEYQQQESLRRARLSSDNSHVLYQSQRTVENSFASVGGVAALQNASMFTIEDAPASFGTGNEAHSTRRSVSDNNNNNNAHGGLALSPDGSPPQLKRLLTLLHSELMAVEQFTPTANAACTRIAESTTVLYMPYEGGANPNLYVDFTQLLPLWDLSDALVMRGVCESEVMICVIDGLVTDLKAHSTLVTLESSTAGEPLSVVDGPLTSANANKLKDGADYATPLPVQHGRISNDAGNVSSASRGARSPSGAHSVNYSGSAADSSRGEQRGGAALTLGEAVAAQLANLSLEERHITGVTLDLENVAANVRSALKHRLQSAPKTVAERARCGLLGMGVGEELRMSRLPGYVFWTKAIVRLICECLDAVESLVFAVNGPVDWDSVTIPKDNLLLICEKVEEWSSMIAEIEGNVAQFCEVLSCLRVDLEQLAMEQGGGLDDASQANAQPDFAAGKPPSHRVITSVFIPKSTLTLEYLRLAMVGRVRCLLYTVPVGLVVTNGVGAGRVSGSPESLNETGTPHTADLMSLASKASVPIPITGDAAQLMSSVTPDGQVVFSEVSLPRVAQWERTADNLFEKISILKKFNSAVQRRLNQIVSEGVETANGTMIVVPPPHFSHGFGIEVFLKETCKNLTE